MPFGGRPAAGKSLELDNDRRACGHSRTLRNHTRVIPDDLCDLVLGPASLREYRERRPGPPSRTWLAGPPLHPVQPVVVLLLHAGHPLLLLGLDVLSRLSRLGLYPLHFALSFPADRLAPRFLL